MNEDLVPGLRALVPIRPFLKDRLVKLPVRLQGEWEGKPRLPESGARRVREAEGRARARGGDGEKEGEGEGERGRASAQPSSIEPREGRDEGARAR